MPVSCFPTRPAVFRKPVSLLKLIPSLFQEHLPRSGQPSSSIKSLVLDYKKHQLLAMPSVTQEGGVRRTNTEAASRHATVAQNAGGGPPGSVSPRVPSHLTAFRRRQSEGSKPASL